MPRNRQKPPAAGGTASNAESAKGGRRLGLALALYAAGGGLYLWHSSEGGFPSSPSGTILAFFAASLLFAATAAAWPKPYEFLWRHSSRRVSGFLVKLSLVLVFFAAFPVILLLRPLFSRRKTSGGETFWIKPAAAPIDFESLRRPF